MHLRILSAIIKKDVTLFFRNRFFALITGLALFAYAGIYYLMPAEVDEQIELGFYAKTIPQMLQEVLEEEGVDLVTWESVEALRGAVLEGEVQAGLALSDDLAEQILSGEKPVVELYLRSDLSEDLREVYAVLVQELGYMLGGQSLNLEVQEYILGVDRAGMQIPVRERLVPLIAVLLLMMETMGLATLISSEIQEGTLQALMISPMSVEGFFVGKGITGVALSFIQAVLVLALIGGLQQGTPLLLFSLFLGAVMVTGIGFLMGAAVKDVLSILPWSVLMFIVLSIPAIDLLIPGILTGWIKVIPSYYLVDTLYRVITQAASWVDVSQNLWLLLAAGIASLGLGVMILRRHLQ